MQLREEGKLRLDDPVEKYLPWFKAAPAGDDDGPITIEQLLSHSSGLQREAGDHWVSYEFPTADQLKQRYADRQAAFAPSVRWKYSNLAYAVAGMVIEQVSGQRWADYVDRNIFQPLGMTVIERGQERARAHRSVRAPDARRHARGAALRRRTRDGAATGITSNVEDMAKFVSANFRSGPRGGAQVVSTGIVARDAPRALGRGELDLGDRASASTSAASTIGPGSDMAAAIRAIRRMTLLQLDDKVGVIVLTNTNDSNPCDIARQLIAHRGGRRWRRRRRRSRRSWRGIRRGRASRVSIAAGGAIRMWSCSTRSWSSSHRTERTWTTRSRWSHSAAAGSASPRRPVAASWARSCDSSSSPAGRCGCTRAIAGSTAFGSRNSAADVPHDSRR